MVSGSGDNTLKLWDLESGQCLRTFEGHTSAVFSVCVHPDGQWIVSGSWDKTLKLWDLASGECLRTFEGHAGEVNSLAIHPDGQWIVSGSADKTLKLWDIGSGQCLRTFEGHTAAVYSVCVHPDGERMVSGSGDNTLKLWDLETLACLQTLKATNIFGAVAISQGGSRMVAGNDNGSVYVYHLANKSPVSPGVLVSNVRYTNAKVVLMGESGVGKSGLGHRLAEDRWVVTESTHGMQVWPLALPQTVVEPGIEREVWLWDLAGQPEYRLVHQLFLDETAVALMLFDASRLDDPLREIGDWEKALKAAVKRDPIKLLVAARTDRSSVTLTEEKIRRFCEERGFAEYFATSAQLDRGCAELKAALARYIPWERLPVTGTTRLFKALKDAIVRLKDEGIVLVRLTELRQRLQLALPAETFTEDELRTVVSLLGGQGLIKPLAFGDFVLLQPEQMNSYASAVVRAARAHVDGIGCIAEREVLAGTFDAGDLPRLAQKDEEEVLLRSMVQTFLDQSLCIRETTGAGDLLVFPSQYNRERDIQDHPTVFVTYRFSGPLPNLYTTLVVRLHYSGFFDKKELWKNAAEFWTPERRTIGLVMKRVNEGIGEIKVFFENEVPDDTRVIFIKFIHEHLLKRAQEVVRERDYACPKCGKLVVDKAAIKARLETGKKDIPCLYCPKRIPLFDLIERKFQADQFEKRVQELDAQAQINLDRESLELILVGQAFTVVAEAGQIFRPTPNSDWGIDGEIEFKDNEGKASGKRVYLQLKSGDSYLTTRKRDGKEVFYIKEERHLEYWQTQAYPVFLVIRSSDGVIRWMNITDYLQRRADADKDKRQIVFDGEPFNFISVVKLRERFIPRR